MRRMWPQEATNKYIHLHEGSSLARETESSNRETIPSGNVEVGFHRAMDKLYNPHRFDI